MWSIFSPRFQKSPDTEFAQNASSRPTPSPSITIRVCQTAAAAGIVAGVTRSILSGIEGDKVRSTEAVCLAGMSLSTLLLANRYSTLQGINECGKKLSKLNQEFKSREEEVEELNHDLIETEGKIASLQVKEAAIVKDELAAERILQRELSETQRREAETAHALKEAQEQLRKRTKQFEDQLSQWKKMQEQDQNQIRLLEGNIKETKSQIGSLQTELATHRELSHEREKQMSTFHSENLRLQKLISEMEEASSRRYTEEIGHRSDALRGALQRGSAALEQVSASLDRLEKTIPKQE